MAITHDSLAVNASAAEYGRAAGAHRKADSAGPEWSLRALLLRRARVNQGGACVGLQRRIECRRDCHCLRYVALKRCASRGEGGGRSRACLLRAPLGNSTVEVRARLAGTSHDAAGKPAV